MFYHLTLISHDAQLSGEIHSNNSNGPMVCTSAPPARSFVSFVFLMAENLFSNSPSSADAPPHTLPTLFLLLLQDFPLFLILLCCNSVRQVLALCAKCNRELPNLQPPPPLPPPPPPPPPTLKPIGCPNDASEPALQVFPHAGTSPVRCSTPSRPRWDSKVILWKQRHRMTLICCPA